MCHSCSELVSIDNCHARLLFHKARQSRRKTNTFNALKHALNSRHHEKIHPYSNIRLEVVEAPSKPQAKPRTVYPSKTPPKPKKRHLKPEPKPRTVFPSKLTPKPRKRELGSKIINGENDASPVAPSILEMTSIVV